MRPSARMLVLRSWTTKPRALVRCLASKSHEFKNLPSQEEGQRSPFSKRFSHVMDNMQSNVFTVGQRLNDLTGYSGIEALKKDIENQENSLGEKREALRRAREAYSTAISQRSASQREVNELLQRKHAWSPQDLERFTTLYRSDHENERIESVASAAVSTAEREAEEASTHLGASILARYHEEQIWSDKIRRMSTWGTWGLMGVNILLFVIFQIAIEPWRRRRLVGGFENKVKEALEKGEGRHDATASNTAAFSVDALPEAIPPSTEVIADASRTTESLVKDIEDQPSTKPAPLTLGSQSLGNLLELWRTQCADMLSTESITLRKIDLTARALESAFAGAVIAGVIATIVRNR